MHDAIGRHVAVIHRQTRRFFHAALAEYELPWDAPPALYEVLTGAPMRQEQLAARLRLDEGTTSRLITRLESAGLVERRPDPADHRARTLHPTPRAEVLGARLAEMARAWEGRLVRSLTPEETTTLRALLRRVADGCSIDGAEDEGSSPCPNSASQHNGEGS